MRKRNCIAFVERDSETNLLVGYVPGLAGVHSQGATLDELHQNLKEALLLCLEEGVVRIEDFPEFVSLQQIEVCVGENSPS